MVFLASIFANFGGAHFNSRIDKMNSYKLGMLTALFSGVVIWAYYQASLTSELAIKLESYPSNDLQSFSKTNYR